MSLGKFIGKSCITGKQLDKIEGTISKNNDGTINYQTSDGIYNLQPLNGSNERYKVMFKVANKK